MFFGKLNCVSENELLLGVARNCSELLGIVGKPGAQFHEFRTTTNKKTFKSVAKGAFRPFRAPWGAGGPVEHRGARRACFRLLTVIVIVIIYSLKMLIMKIRHRLLPVEHRGAPGGPWSTVGPVGRVFVFVFVVLIVIVIIYIMKNMINLFI